MLVKSACVKNKSPRLAAEASSLLPGYHLSQQTHLGQGTKVFISSQGLLGAFPNREVVYITSPTALLTETLDLWPAKGVRGSKAETCLLLTENLRIEFLCACQADGMSVYALEIISPVLEPVSPTARTITDSFTAHASREGCTGCLSRQQRVSGFVFQYSSCPCNLVCGP